MGTTGAVGLFGGCLDPVHNGHAAICAAAADLPVERVLMVVNGQPAHRRPPSAAYRHRVAMAAIVEGLLSGGRIRVELSELEKPGRPRYAIDTVEEIGRQGMWPVLMLGSDALAGLPSWHRWQDLLAMASFAVIDRAGRPADELHPRLEGMLVPDAAELAARPCVWRWDAAVPDCASSRIRSQLAAGNRQQAARCLDERVFEYIGRAGLYAGAAGK